jgi:hypothetical protein
MIKVIFLTLITWSTPGAANATVDSLRMETVGGKQFIIHQIDEKETLYAISRRYGVPRLLQFWSTTPRPMAV